MILTSTYHAFRCLEGHGAQIVHARIGTSDDHCILTTDLIACQGMIRRKLCSILDDIKIWQSGLHHDNIGALLHVAFLMKLMLAH